MQRRLDPAFDFYRTWTQYEEGFGDPDADYWMSLKEQYRRTSICTAALHVTVLTQDDVPGVAVYQRFSVGDASTQYQLYIADYSGDAGDALTGRQHVLVLHHIERK